MGVVPLPRLHRRGVAARATIRAARWGSVLPRSSQVVASRRDITPRGALLSACPVVLFLGSLLDVPRRRGSRT